jgi:arginase
LINLEEFGPYVRDEDIYVVGVHSGDEHLEELASNGICVTNSKQVEARDAALIGRELLTTVTANTEGCWVHFHVEVVDAGEIPAVDCPDIDGPPFSTVCNLLKPIVASPRFVGIDVTIYDPDLDCRESVRSG